VRRGRKGQFLALRILETLLEIGTARLQRLDPLRLRLALRGIACGCFLARLADVPLQPPSRVGRGGERRFEPVPFLLDLGQSRARAMKSVQRCSSAQCSAQK